MTGVSGVEQKVLDRIQKLLNMASHKETPPAEAANAARMAQDLLLQHGLSADVVGEASTEGSGAREDTKQRGGTYKYQRKLWGAIAELNFCMYWCARMWGLHDFRKNSGREMRHGYAFKHRLVGKRVNIAATKAMAGYLEEAIHRITLEWCQKGKHGYYSAMATAFKEGMASDFVDRLKQRRRHLMKEEERKQADAERQANDSATVSTATGLTIATLAKSEEQANYDFIHGDGAWARSKADMAAFYKEREAISEEYRRDLEAITKEAADNLDKFRREEAKLRARYKERGWLFSSVNRTTRFRGDKYKSDGREDSWAFSAGRESAKNISLEQQVDKAEVSGLIGRS
jgi:hypothetical protein